MVKWLENQTMQSKGPGFDPGGDKSFCDEHVHISGFGFLSIITYMSHFFLLHVFHINNRSSVCLMFNVLPTTPYKNIINYHSQTFCLMLLANCIGNILSMVNPPLNSDGCLHISVLWTIQDNYIPPAFFVITWTYKRGRLQAGRISVIAFWRRADHKNEASQKKATNNNM